MRRTLFVIIDALTARVVRPAMEEGRLPTLSALAEHGLYRDECISIFPSITPAATAALVTGAYPIHSGIAGACWLDRETGDLAYYGDDIRAIWNHGVREYFRSFLVRLNYERLDPDTIYELAADADLTASCFNLMWFRGPRYHRLHKPWLADLITCGEMPDEVAGPDSLLLGDFVDSVLADDTESAEVAGLTNSYGFRDETTAASFLAAARADQLRDVNVVYFPTNDFRSHEVGPEGSLDVVEGVDRVLGEFVSINGGIERAAEEWQILITGDHSHSTTIDLPDRAIELDRVLPDFRIAPAGAGWSNEYDLVAGPNMRSVNFYCREPETQRPQLVEALLADPRIDQAIWQIQAESGRPCWRVQTSERGQLTFNRDQDGKYDEFGGRWNWSGDLSVVDATVKGDQLDFGDYPNAFERIACSVCERFGDVWVTAKPGYEFQRPATGTHDGGSHGSLHRDDSLAPLIALGIDDSDVPNKVRIVDMLPLLAARGRYSWHGRGVGQPHS